MLKKLLLFGMMICFITELANAGGSDATKGEKWSEPRTGEVLECPEISNNLKLVSNPDGSKTIDFGATKVEVYGIAIYGYSDATYFAKKTADGRYILPYMKGFTVVVKGADGNWHYIYLDDEQRIYNIWDKSVTVITTARGSKLTSPDWLRQEYR